MEWETHMRAAVIQSVNLSIVVEKRNSPPFRMNHHNPRRLNVRRLSYGDIVGLRVLMFLRFQRMGCNHDCLLRILSKENSL